MDWAAQTNCYRAHCEALDTHNLVSVWRHQVPELKQQRLYKVHVFSEIAHTHAQNAPLEWFSSTPRQGAVHVEGVEWDLLVAHLVIRGLWDHRQNGLALCEDEVVELCIRDTGALAHMFMVFPDESGQRALSVNGLRDSRLIGLLQCWITKLSNYWKVSSISVPLDVAEIDPL